METLPHEKQIFDYIQSIERLKTQNQKNPLFSEEITRLEQKLTELKEDVYSKLTAWERILISRHPSRPRTLDYINNLTDDFCELSGDRNYKDDHAIVGGLARINGQKFMVIGQEKGNDTDSRVYRNFGMLNPEGFKKALRLMKLAEKFSLPIVSFLDSPGAFPGLEAEERGQGWAIAYNLREMAVISTPIIVIIIGEGCSGGALGMGVGDVVCMLEHSCYSVISPEGCASILWKDAAKKMEAASALKLNAENLLELGIIDKIISEPLGGAHHDTDFIYNEVKKTILGETKRLQKIDITALLEARYQKFRKMGRYQEV